MTDQKIEKLIQTLSEDLKPVRPVRLNGLIIKWLSLSVLVSLVIVYFFGFRQDWLHLFQKSTFYLELGFLLALYLFSAIMAFRLTIPGLENKTKKSFFVFLILLFLLGFYFLGISDLSFQNISRHMKMGYECTAMTFVLAILPFAAFQVLAMKLFPVRHFLLAWYVSLTSLTGASFFMEWHCMNDQGMHKFLWHYLSVLLIALVLLMPLAFLIFRRK